MSYSPLNEEYDEKEPVMIVKPITSINSLKSNSTYNALKMFVAIFAAISIGIILVVSSNFFMLFVVMFLTHQVVRINDFMLFAVVFVFLLVVLPIIIDYLVINYLKNTKYLIYDDKITHKSFFPVYSESDIYFKNILEVGSYQGLNEAQKDIGSIFLSAKRGGAILCFIPNFKEVQALLKKVSKSK
ncbi:MAG: hypothetical protein WCK67_09190 [bacterium]